MNGKFSAELPPGAIQTFLKIHKLPCLMWDLIQRPFGPATGTFLSLLTSPREQSQQIQ